MSGTAAGGTPGSSNGALSSSAGGLGSSSALALVGLGAAEEKDGDLLCPVCFELISEAYVTRCGHSFCFACVAKAVDAHRRCPKCGAALASRDHIFPNFVLNELVAKRRALVGDTSQPMGGLSALLAAGARLPPEDVERLLGALARRRKQQKACSAAQHQRLLKDFLQRLLAQRERQLKQLSREAALVRRDLGAVATGSLAPPLQEDDDLGPLSPPPSTPPPSLTHSAPPDPTDEDESFAAGPSTTDDTDAIADRWKRLSTHFEDFVQCYFAHRAEELYFPAEEEVVVEEEAAVPQGGVGGPEGDQQAPEPIGPVRTTTTSSGGLAAFREDLVAFTRYRALRPLATLSYCSDAINYSTIVSTIEFDKDEEYFAIAGVTKRIKVFEFAAVARDAVDVHYPCAEMTCAHKVSCVSWNNYHKQVLAAADYEGTVSVWDAHTAQRTRALQEHDKRAWSVHFNKCDVRLLASGSDDARVKLWALNAERAVATLEARFNVCCVRFNPKSAAHLAFGSADHCVHYYDLRQPRRPLAVFKDHRKAVSYVQFLDAHRLVSASTDSQLKLWKVESPRCVRSFTGHANEKNFVGLATDGKYVACGSENNALYVYYSGLSRPLLAHRFDAARGFLSEKRDEEPPEFVSAVCWRRRHRPALLAANSQGTIKVLELV